jgi:molybdate-binding protein
LGSHDPLLDWALRESGAGLATFFDGSADGLERFTRYEGVASGLHIFAPQQDDWNVPLIRQRFAAEPVVLVEFAWRQRGLIIAPGMKNRITAIDDLRGLTLAPRQAGAGSQSLLDFLLGQAGLREQDITLTPPARTETDAALTVQEGKANAAFGLLDVAAQLGLDFVPLMRERFDLLVDRRAWFEPPLQRFLAFCHSTEFRDKAAELNGYDITGFGRVHFNGL